jgi:flagellar biosynthesis protein FlhF
VAARPDDIDRLRRRLSPAAPKFPVTRGARPLVVALVGPTGAGTTTTAAKLALSPEAFGARRVGLLTLDTYRVGGLDEMQTYADIAALPLEVVYDEREVAGAMKRLERCDVVIVDTPGRSPRAGANNARWQGILAALAPDEVHLVVPATMRADLAGALRAALGRTPPTHLVLSKVDEVPEDGGLAALASRIDLPMRWIADGQTVPDDVRSARPRILASLGLSESALESVAA